MSEQTDVSRRGLFQIIGAASAGAALSLPKPIEAAQPHAQGQPASPQYSLFDAHQQKTVAVLADLILPADDRGPAASATGVVAFMDDWITFRTEQDGYDRLKAEILGGLTWIDRESNRLFHADFADASVAQQKQILDRIAWPAKAAPEDRHWADFFSSFRDLVVAGYFSSKQGVADLPYLGNTAVVDWIGCEPKVWAIIEQRLNSGDYKGLINPENQQV